MSQAFNEIVAEDMHGVLQGSLPWDRLGGKSVLITGATGLVGAFLTETLLCRNEVFPGPPCRVVALVRDKQRAAARFAHHGPAAALQLLVQNVEEPVPSDLCADFIIHAAGNATPHLFGNDPVGTYRGALLGTHYLLRHAQHVGSQGFLLLSTGAVHGHISGDHTIVDERVIGSVDPLDPYACYAESKRMAETMCASWARQFGTPARIARLGHTYGPGLRREDDRAFAQFAYAIVDRNDISLQTDGAAVRPYCYLSDAVDALFRILLMGSDGEAYLLANTAATCSIIELATLLVDMFPERGSRLRMLAPAIAASIANQDPYRKLSIAKLQSLGWAPQVGIRAGFQRTVRSLL
jgi:UDP-glucuronate decarboxylase